MIRPCYGCRSGFSPHSGGVLAVCRLGCGWHGFAHKHHEGALDKAREQHERAECRRLGPRCEAEAHAEYVEGRR